MFDKELEHKKFEKVFKEDKISEHEEILKKIEELKDKLDKIQPITYPYYPYYHYPCNYPNCYHNCLYCSYKPYIDCSFYYDDYNTG